MSIRMCVEIACEITPPAARLWGLTENELKEIQESLEELGEGTAHLRVSAS